MVLLYPLGPGGSCGLPGRPCVRKAGCAGPQFARYRGAGQVGVSPSDCISAACSSVFGGVWSVESGRCSTSSRPASTLFFRSSGALMIGELTGAARGNSGSASDITPNG